VNRALAIEGLVVERSGATVLTNLSFEVPAGSLVGLLGPSGSGKSTLLRSLLGAQRISAGRVEVLGRSAGSPALRSRVGYMAQSSAIYLDLSVEQNVTYFAAVLDCAKSEVPRVIDLVALTPLRKRLVSSLSGGERVRVSLAIALLGAPPLMLLDEPTVGLDPLLRRDLWQTFTDIMAAGSTVLVSSHVMDEAARCERLLLLRGGNLLFDATPADLLATTGAATFDDAFIALIEKGGSNATNATH